MIIPELNVPKAKEQMKEWIAYEQLPNINEKYKVFENTRNYLQDELKRILTELPEHRVRRLYLFDVEMGLSLYRYFEKFGINLRTAANADFWRYMTMIVAPDVVKVRWGMNEERYWKTAQRNWFGETWWYIYLSWQGSIEETKKILLTPCCSTDTINNLVERTGSDGTDVEVYRNIMKYYTQINYEDIKAFNKKTETLNDSLFRTIMRLNTAKIMVIEPELCEGGVVGYVRSLFVDAGIILKKEN